MDRNDAIGTQPVRHPDKKNYPLSGQTNGFPDNSGWNAYQSRDGVLWITTEEANLYRVDPFRQPINHTKTDGSFGGGNGGTSSILEDKNGFLWVGTWGHGLLKFDQQKRLVHKFENDPSDPTSLFDNSVLLHFPGTGRYPMDRYRPGD